MNQSQTRPKSRDRMHFFSKFQYGMSHPCYDVQVPTINNDLIRLVYFSKICAGPEYTTYVRIPRWERGEEDMRTPSNNECLAGSS